ncbi:MAG: hypothetical protein K5989_01330 [Lachnospiraceae bacterium]|nr:hypothetical protein [Lachnospiraceae bacterium]
MRAMVSISKGRGIIRSRRGRGIIAILLMAVMVVSHLPSTLVYAGTSAVEEINMEMGDSGDSGNKLENDTLSNNETIFISENHLQKKAKETQEEKKKRQSKVLNCLIKNGVLDSPVDWSKIEEVKATEGGDGAIIQDDSDTNKTLTNKVTVTFNPGYGKGDYEDQVVSKAGTVVEPTAPVYEDWEFYGWYAVAQSELDYKDFDSAVKWDFKKTVQENYENYQFEFGTDSSGNSLIVLYAYYIPTYQFADDFMILSSTGLLGNEEYTVIGQGCKVKLQLANQDGSKMDDSVNKVVKWNIVALTNDGSAWDDGAILKNDTSLAQYFKLKKVKIAGDGNIKNGGIKCKKEAKTGYRVMVTAQYQNKLAYYVMTVMPRIKKFGYYVGDKFVNKAVVERTLAEGSTYECDFGYGPSYFAQTPVYYYDKTNQIVGLGTYDDYTYYYNDAYNYNTDIQNCHVKYKKNKIIKKTKTAKYYDYEDYYYSYYYDDLDYFDATKTGSYKIQFVAPDGSNQKFSLTFKFKKPKKVKGSKK